MLLEDHLADDLDGTCPNEWNQRRRECKGVEGVRGGARGGASKGARGGVRGARAR